jgi:hypothetical protein
MPRLIIPFMLFAGFGLYFGLQACPTFYFWDSAELTAAVLANGVPHPPGFPFFLILAKLWDLLMPIEPARALNLFSAFFAAIGLTVWYVVIRKLISDLDHARRNRAADILALIATILIGVSFTFGMQATRLEVYSLNFAGFAILVLLALNIKTDRQRFSGRKLLFFALLGLMLGVHNLTIALAIPGLLIIASAERGLRPREIILGLSISVLIFGGLYLLIYFRSGADPALNWGHPSSFRSLIDYIFIKGFSTSVKGDWLSHLFAQAAFVIDLLRHQIGIAGMLFAALGAVYFALNQRRLSIALLITLLLNLMSISFAADYFYENFDLHGYLLISLSIVGIFLAAGLEFVYQLITRNVKSAALRLSSPWAVLLSASLGVAVCIGPMRNNMFSANLSQLHTADTYASSFLNDAPDSAIILTSSYNTYFCLLARQAGDHQYDGQAVYNIYNWDHKWGRAQTNDDFSLEIPDGSPRQEYYRSFVNATMTKRPLYVEYDPSSRPLARYLHPLGLGYLFSLDSDYVELNPVFDQTYISRAESSTDIESIRTWVLWLQNRGEFYRDRGIHEIADAYFATLNNVVENVELK